MIVSSFRTRAALHAEILALRHQLAVLQASAPRHLRLQRSDRVLWVLLSRFWSGWRRCLQILQPATVIAWHRRAFAWYWTRKSRRRPGRPEVSAEIRDLIQRMSRANPLWGAPRIHGELLKLGIAVAQSTVANYLRRRQKPPSQTWRTFLTNHIEQTASIDFFTVPTATFRVLFVFVVLSHARRRVLHFGVTEHPTEEWTVQQIREAFPWDQTLRYLLRDRDAIYGSDFAAITKGDGRRGDCPASALAESLRGTASGIHPARMPGSCHRVEPKILASNSATLFCLLPRLPHASVARKGFACQPIGRAAHGWQRDRNSKSRRTTSSLHSEGCMKEATFEPFSSECRRSRAFVLS